VHVIGAGFALVFNLNCPDGPPELRDFTGKPKASEIRRAGNLVEKHLAVLCEAWRKHHGNY
jgi:hypothetical protein